jgi:hypothetical protein
MIELKDVIMDVRSMRGSSGIPDHFIVKIKVRFRLSMMERAKSTCQKGKH